MHWYNFTAMTLLVGWCKGHVICKILVMAIIRGYLWSCWPYPCQYREELCEFNVFTDMVWCVCLFLHIFSFSVPSFLWDCHLQMTCIVSRRSLNTAIPYFCCEHLFLWDIFVFFLSRWCILICASVADLLVAHSWAQATDHSTPSSSIFSCSASLFLQLYLKPTYPNFFFQIPWLMLDLAFFSALMLPSSSVISVAC